MGWECFCVVGFDLGPLLQGRMRILHLQYFFKYVLTYSLHCLFLLSASEFFLNMLFNYHLLYFCTALSLIIMLSSHYYLHKSKTLNQLTQCPFTGTLLLLKRYIFNLFLKQGRVGAERTSSGKSFQTLRVSKAKHVAKVFF